MLSLFQPLIKIPWFIIIYYSCDVVVCMLCHMQSLSLDFKQALIHILLYMYVCHDKKFVSCHIVGMHRVHDTSLQVVHACINRKWALSYHVDIKFQILYQQYLACQNCCGIPTWNLHKEGRWWNYLDPNSISHATFIVLVCSVTNFL